MKLSHSLSQKLSLQLSTAMALDKGLEQVHELVKYHEEKLTTPRFLKEIHSFFLKAGKKSNFGNIQDSQHLLAQAPHLLAQALHYAASRHQGEYRDSGNPYLAHVLSTGFILARLGFPKELVMAGILHDSVEDAPDKNKVINDLFQIDPQIAFYVYSVSAPDIKDSVEKDLQLFTRIQSFSSSAGNIYPQAIKCADGISNLYDMGKMDGKDGRTAQQRKLLFLQKSEKLLLPFARKIDEQGLIRVQKKKEKFLLEEYLTDLINEKKLEFF